MKLYEEFKEYENMWETVEPQKARQLTEDADDAYAALMDAQEIIENLPGWTLVDCVQDDEYTMMLRCNLAPDVYVWHETDDGEVEYEEDVAEAEEQLRNLGVSLSIVDDEPSSNCDIRVYLSFEDYAED